MRRGSVRLRCRDAININNAIKGREGDVVNVQLVAGRCLLPATAAATRYPVVSSCLRIRDALIARSRCVPSISECSVYINSIAAITGAVARTARHPCLGDSSAAATVLRQRASMPLCTPRIVCHGVLDTQLIIVSTIGTCSHVLSANDYDCGDSGASQCVKPMII